MYIVYDLTTMEVLGTHPNPVDLTDQNRWVPTEVETYTDWDPATMGFLPCPQDSLGTWWAIKNGQIVDSNLAEVLTVQQWPIAKCKPLMKQHFSDLSFEKRTALLPDYKLSNAGLGVYDAATTASILNTVTAFRDEYYRLEGLIDTATTIADLVAIAENFPTELIP